ncbi:hypothetical protein [Gryllotalpicola protaetiae]|uniref:Uncharacterized protein n=1 Tax=Gryllotalpicola protaetiae TaxID=2419771 RepID=A0A387BKT4_9MICO|nr:hypothetical protein [Gryllotalpicola protaetiae]AYG02774.1 hypothetical protein D7I44_04065 [Gryllotalpicola protaetiae]
MAGIRMNGDGVAATVAALTSHASSASDNARAAESALTDVEVAARSPQLASALGNFVSRFTAQATKVSEHIDALGGGLNSAAAAISETDSQIGDSARSLTQR